jgi:peptide/nickel transport system ATP-binding protein
VTPTPLLELQGLRAWYHVRRGLFRTAPVKAVDGVSLALGRGETLALVGESGSGKTTLGRAVLRLMEIAGGRVLFDGSDVTRLDAAGLRVFRRRAQAVFQDPFSSISPFMTAGEIVEEGLLIQGVRGRLDRQERVRRAMRQVRLEPVEEIAGKYPHNLSGGQRQRVSIARAVVLEPELVVADEPVSMVDASNRAEILQLLRELQAQRGITFLYITHDLASARHFSDRTAVLYLGTLAELGPTARVIEKPLHPYTQGLLEAVPEPDPENRKRLRAVVRGEPPSAANVPPGCPFHPRCPKSIAGRCELARPALLEASPGHHVACVLYQ